MVVAIMPLLSPVVLGDAPFNVAPESMKAAWGAVAVLLLLSGWLLLQSDSKALTINKNTIYLPVVALMIWSIISLLWVEDGFLAATMLSQLVSYGLVMFLVMQLIKDKIESKVFLILSFVLCLVSIVGLLQYYFPENFFIQNMFVQTAKPGATFANKNMASHFLVMVLPLSIVGLLSSSTHRVRVFYTITTAVAGWFLIYTVARQGYLAISVELLLLTLFLFLDYRKNREHSLVIASKGWRSNVLHSISIIFFLIIASNFTVDGWSGGTHSKLDKLQTIGVEGGAARYPAWLNTLEMIKEHPLRGVGVGQWSESYPQYYDRVEKDVIFNEKVKLKRLHNDYLETLANVGLIGYAFLLWILFLVGRKVFQVILDVKNPRRWPVLALSLGMVGFSVVAMFSFPIRVYLPPFLLFFYFGLLFISEKRSDRFSMELSARKRKIFFVGAVAALFMSVGVVKISYEWLMAESHALRAVALENHGELRLAAGGALEALKYNNWAPNYFTAAGISLVKLEKAKEAIPILKKAIDISPYNSDALLVLSLAYGHLKQFDMERKVLLFVLSFDPHNVRAAAFLVRHFYQQQQFKEATFFYKKVKENYHYFLGRANFGPYHDLVGQVAVSVKDFKYAKKVFERDIEESSSAEKYMKLAALEYYHLGNKERGLELFKLALKEDPNIKKADQIKALINGSADVELEFE